MSALPEIQANPSTPADHGTELSVVGDIIDHSHLPYKAGAIIFLAQLPIMAIQPVCYHLALGENKFFFVVDIIKRLLIHERVTS